MDTYLLFRKKAPLTEDGLPWLRGAETHTFTAKRNTAISASPVYLSGRAAQHTIGNSEAGSWGRNLL